jgi:hypothetical protein
VKLSGSFSMNVLKGIAIMQLTKDIKNKNKINFIIFSILIKINFFKINLHFQINSNFGDWGLGIGDWGLGIGDWAQSPIPNPQIPNPQSPIPNMSLLLCAFLRKNIS